MPESIILVAFLWGALSAISLPLGAGLGLLWRPKEKINSAFMAFGAGALLFALTIELFGHVPHHVEEHGLSALAFAIGGALLGGFLFDTFNTILNNQGAFFRHLSSAKKYIRILKRKRVRRLIRELSQIKAMANLPPKLISRLIYSIDEVGVNAGEWVFRQGDAAREMYFIVEGEIDIILNAESGQKKQIATLGAGETFGELGVLLGLDRTADAVAKSGLRLYKLEKSSFDAVSRRIPELKVELKKLAEHRYNELSVKATEEAKEEWQEEAMENLDTEKLAVTMEDIKKESGHGKGGAAAMAIWLGILIDSFPESLIIGMLAISPTGMSLAFVAGVFLANLPEAMSSAVSMKNSGMTTMKIMLMWGSLCILTGCGAALGSVIFPPEPTGSFFYVYLAIEGLAAGAMLTMIAETMLPEAFEQGGRIVGMSTLFGFIAALLVKVLS